MTALQVARASKVLVSVDWVARHYGVSRMTIHRAIRDGKLAGRRLRGGRTLYLDVRELPEEL